MNICRTTGLVLAALAVSVTGFAQDNQVQQIKENVDIFSGVLTRSLDLDEATGLFGLSTGGVESSYLMGQGAVFEVRTPLAARRNRVGLASLSNTLQTLHSGGNPFAVVRRSSGPEEAQVSAVAIRSGGANTYYVEMMDRMANVDYTLAVNSAVQQAYDAARSLLSLGSIDDQAYTSLRAEIDQLNQALEAKLGELRQAQGEVQADANVESDDATAMESLRENLDVLAAEIEPLREQVMAKAAELKVRNEQAAEEYARNWRQEVVEFENRVYRAICDYGATLRAIPASENVTIILSDLGEDSADNSLTDKVLVFAKADIDQCQAGSIDAEGLRARARSYSY